MGFSSCDDYDECEHDDNAAGSYSKGQEDNCDQVCSNKGEGTSLSFSCSCITPFTAAGSRCTLLEKDTLEISMDNSFKQGQDFKVLNAKLISSSKKDSCHARDGKSKEFCPDKWEIVSIHPLLIAKNNFRNNQVTKLLDDSLKDGIFEIDMSAKVSIGGKEIFGSAPWSDTNELLFPIQKGDSEMFLGQEAGKLVTNIKSWFNSTYTRHSPVARDKRPATDSYFYVNKVGDYTIYLPTGCFDHELTGKPFDLKLTSTIVPNNGLDYSVSFRDGKFRIAVDVTKTHTNPLFLDFSYTLFRFNDRSGV